MTAPAFGSLQWKYQIAAFSFTIPTIIFLGSLYAVCPYRPLMTTLTPLIVCIRANDFFPHIPKFASSSL
jgi:hypothetical protein